MKSTLNLLTWLMLLLPVTVWTQNIQENERTMSKGSKPGFSMTIDGMETKEVERLWLDYLKYSKAKTKKDRKTNEVFSDDASLPAINSNLMDLYATFTERNKQTEMVVWVDLGGAFLARRQHPEKIDAFYQWLNEFGRRIRVRKVEIEQEAEELIFKDQKKEFDKLVKEEERLKKEISDAEQRINQARKELDINAANQNNRRQEMERQQIKIQEIEARKKRVE
jgi:hypothetical protein